MEEVSHASLELLTTEGIIKHSENQLGCKKKMYEYQYRRFTQFNDFYIHVNCRFLFRYVELARFNYLSSTLLRV